MQFQHTLIYRLVVQRKIARNISMPILIFSEQWLPTLGPQMFLDYNSQKSWPEQLVVKAFGSFSPRTSGDPRLGTIDLLQLFIITVCNKFYIIAMAAFPLRYF